MWVGALGSMSWKATTSSSSRTILAGILPSTIWQNRQDTAEQCTPSRGGRECGSLSGRFRPRAGHLAVEFGQKRFDVTRALAEGTQDGRLFLHAAAITAAAGQRAEARGWLNKAEKLRTMLLPSELAELARIRERVTHTQVALSTR